MDILEDFIKAMNDVTQDEKKIVVEMRYNNSNTGLIAPVVPIGIKKKGNVLTINSENDERLDIDLADFNEMQYDEFEDEYSLQSTDGSIIFAFTMCA